MPEGWEMLGCQKDGNPSYYETFAAMSSPHDNGQQ
jgi:hypothetical protein